LIQKRVRVPGIHLKFLFKKAVMIQPGLRTIRILIADDHLMLREGFRNLLRRDTEIEFVGEAENGKELLGLTDQLHPDIIFTDISMPVMDGIEATRFITRKHPEIKIIALTNYDEDHLIVDMLEAGAMGYIMKTAQKKEITEAIHAVYDNRTYYCRQTSAKLTKLIALSRFNPHKKSRPEFSEREKDVIQLICQEYSNKEIATLLNLSVRTVEGYREKIQEKMNVHSTAGMVVYAIKKGLYKA